MLIYTCRSGMVVWRTIKNCGYSRHCYSFTLTCLDTSSRQDFVWCELRGRTQRRSVDLGQWSHGRAALQVTYATFTLFHLFIV